MFQVNGVQLNSKPGADFNTQYSVPDTGLTNNTTLAKSNPLYNLLQVMFENTQVNNIAQQEAKCDVISSNGLKVKPFVSENQGKNILTIG